jgi:hypothetical protein
MHRVAARGIDVVHLETGIGLVGRPSGDSMEIWLPVGSGATMFRQRSFLVIEC